MVKLWDTQYHSKSLPSNHQLDYIYIYIFRKSNEEKKPIGICFSLQNCRTVAFVGCRASQVGLDWSKRHAAVPRPWMQMLRQTSKVAPKLADSINNPFETIPKKGVNMSAKHMPKRFKILSLLMWYIQTSSICSHLSWLYIIGGSPMESRIWGDHWWLQLTCT